MALIDTEQIPGIMFRKRRIFIEMKDGERLTPEGIRQAKQDAFDFAKVILAHVKDKRNSQLIIRPDQFGSTLGRN
uniref:Uncharacterized protein n=1 Tax=viral metagenome TaxID=1070528 RepID=A0A6M3JQX7_9ZZZZ